MSSRLLGIPGKLQPLCGDGGGLVSVSEGGAGTEDPRHLCLLCELPCWLLPLWLHVFIFGCMYLRGKERRGDFRLTWVVVHKKAIAQAVSGFWALLDFGKGGLRFIVDI